MSCNGCRVLRKGCSQNCILRPCLQWIQTPEAQANAAVFVAKFFGRAGLMSFISAVPDDHRQSLFQSLLFEAAGRTINPVNGAVGLLWTGNWHVCQASVETILRGGTLQPGPELLNGGDSSELQEPIVHSRSNGQKRRRGCGNNLDLSLKQRLGSPSMNSEDSVTTTCLDAGLRDYKFNKNNDDYNYTTGERAVQILNLFS